MQTSDRTRLLKAAARAAKKAYAPFSRYHVGAALMDSKGRIHTGCNVENSSYGLTNCAERTAIFKAVSEGVKKFKAVAIVAGGSMPYPCGACRQVLAEFCGSKTPVVIARAGKLSAFEETTLGALLPHSFKFGD